MATLSIVDPAGFNESVRRLPSSSSLNEAMLTETDAVLPLAKFASKSAICLRAMGNYDVMSIITNTGAAIFRIGSNNFQHLTELNDVKFCPFCGESFKIDAVVGCLDISADNKWGIR